MPETVCVITPEAPLSRNPALLEWLEANGVEPRNTYRVEVSGDSAEVFQYAVNDEGRKYVDPKTGEVATVGPVEVSTEDLSLVLRPHFDAPQVP